MPIDRQHKQNTNMLQSTVVVKRETRMTGILQSHSQPASWRTEECPFGFTVEIHES